MNYKLVKLADLSGKQTTIYSIKLEGDDKPLFERFIEEHIENYRDEVISIINRLNVIANNTGARHTFFKHEEGKPGDLVCALYDEPEKSLRLYCIRYGNVAVILGSGGPKNKNIRAWQDDVKLTAEATAMIKVSEDIYQRIKDGDLSWSPDGKQLNGNLNFSEDEEEN